MLVHSSVNNSEDDTWNPPISVEGYPPFIRFGAQIEVADTTGNEWYNGFISKVYPFNPEMEQTTLKELKKQSKRYNRIKVLVLINPEWKYEFTVKYNEISTRLRPSNIIFPLWISVGQKTLFYSHINNRWINAVIRRYNDGKFVQLSYRNKADKKMKQKILAINDRLSIFTHNRYDGLYQFQWFPNDIVPIIQSYLPNESSISLYPGTLKNENFKIWYGGNMRQIGFAIRPSKTMYLKAIEVDATIGQIFFSVSLLELSGRSDPKLHWWKNQHCYQLETTVSMIDETEPTTIDYSNSTHCRFPAPVRVRKGKEYFLVFNVSDNTFVGDGQSRAGLKPGEFFSIDGSFDWIVPMYFKCGKPLPKQYTGFAATMPLKWIPQIRLCVTDRLS